MAVLVLRSLPLAVLILRRAAAVRHAIALPVPPERSSLDPQRFLRIHRSTIVNLDRVREIQPLVHGEHRVVLTDGTKLTLSRGYRDRLSRFET